MSDFTTQLRFICESYAGVDQSHPQTIDDIIANSRDKLFDFSYPIFDEAYKPELETKIINHFYTQEIGQETVGLFKQRLKTKMREIMPYYNQLYMSERLKFDPFKNADYVDLHNSRDEGSRRLTSNNTSDFNNQTNRDIVNTHNDQTDGTVNIEGTNNYTDNRATENDGTIDVTGGYDRSGSYSKANNSTDTLSGKDTNTESGSVMLEKEGSELTSDTPINYTNVVTTEADTPLGSTTANSVVNHVNGQGNDGHYAISHNGAINSGYNSKVTQVETVQGSENGQLPHAYTNTRYGKFYNTNHDPDDPGGAVQDSPRKDTTTFNNHKNETSYGKVDTYAGTETGSNTEEDEHQEHTVAHDEGTDDLTHKGTTSDDTTSHSETEGGYRTDDDTTATGLSHSNTSDNETTNGKQDYFGKVFGKVGSETYSEMLNKFRSTFLNIDMDVIHELEPLFMLLW